MDKSQFSTWFRQMASKFNVSDTRLRWMNRSEYSYGELGNYNPNSQVISIDERVLQNDRGAINVGLHELAHAVAMKRDSDSFPRQGDRLTYRLNDPMARGKLLEIERTAGHDSTWLGAARRLGVDVNRYVDKHSPSPMEQLRSGLGLRFKSRG
jgi:hypothetical protein